MHVIGSRNDHNTNISFISFNGAWIR
ncbi:hypothetical protein H4W32_004905 [Actinophytocola algeriensis]|uniref:Uncharacterized protein n=1 Tax=Actinophytocola algeriensis TaxID=1768010 RepID=A0A7W7PZU4_9PSEU|nr:hypothetical protein [Actinophytocola algeriensis]MBE1476863.1 hypothetical protein [Actinophytocola algeriensis]